GPVGVFNVAYGPDSPTMYVLIPHKTIESFGTALDRVRSDADYQKAGTGFINAPATDPSYVRVESSLMVAFAGMPELEAPAAAKETSRAFSSCARTKATARRRTRRKSRCSTTARSPSSGARPCSRCSSAKRSLARKCRI